MMKYFYTVAQTMFVAFAIVNLLPEGDRWLENTPVPRNEGLFNVLAEEGE